MTAEIRWLWSRLNANYWFYPALFSLGAVVLAFILIWLDRNGFAEWLNDVQAIQPARPASASNMLTVIAGAMIGTAATVFSITIAAVAYASGNYGPRLLTNFMEDKGNQLSLATFIGTFVYTVTVLRTVRGEDEASANLEDAAATSLPGFVPQLSLLAAYVLMGVSVAVLVYFLNHIPSSIRINTVLQGIGERLLRYIKDTYPDADRGTAPEPRPAGAPLLASRTGYVQMIDFDDLSKLARDHDCAISLRVRTGDFVHPGMPIAEICDCETADAIHRSFEDTFILGSTRTPKQDPQFLIDELVEIALRALSPGINDPFTAITALHWLGAATASLGTRDLGKTSKLGEDDREGQPRRIYPLPDDFEHFVQRGFGGVRGAVATSPAATLVMFDTLRHASEPIDDESRVALLRREGTRLIEQARDELFGPDLQDVEARFAGFEAFFAR